MATEQQILTLLDQFEKIPPSQRVQTLDQNTVGIRAILKYVNETEGKITAGMISEHIKVTTARVAVLLRKMAERGYIVKESDPGDGRVVVVKLTPEGKRQAEEIKNEIYSILGEMIDKFGIEKMLEYSEISNEIHTLMMARRAAM